MIVEHGQQSPNVLHRSSHGHMGMRICQIKFALTNTSNGTNQRNETLRSGDTDRQIMEYLPRVEAFPMRG